MPWPGERRPALRVQRHNANAQDLKLKIHVQGLADGTSAYSSPIRFRSSLDRFSDTFLVSSDLILAALGDINYSISHYLTALLEIRGPISRRFRDLRAHLVSGGKRKH